LNLERRQIDDAAAALRIANDLAAHSYGGFEREKFRLVLKEGGELVRFGGQVVRFFRRAEGYLSLPGSRSDLYFRVQPDLADAIKIGAKVTFGIGLRIRGLRAIDVQIDE